MAIDQTLTAYLPLSAIPAGPAAGSAPAAKPNLDDIADPTKVASQSLSFSDVLSALNPLQHIPIVGTIYRAVTGDTLNPAARVLGGTLLGGPMGLLASAANAIIEQATGKDLGDQVLALVMPAKNDAPDPAPLVAAATSAAPAVADQSSAPASAATEDTAPTALPETAAAPVEAPAPVQPTAAAQAPHPTAPASGVTAAGGGRTLADYWAGAGHKSPLSGTATASGPSLQRKPIPLQVSVPSDVRHAPIMAAAPVAVGNDKPANDWIAAAMMQGLDRYRQMKQREEQQNQAPRIDTAL